MIKHARQKTPSSLAPDGVFFSKDAIECQAEAVYRREGRRYLQSGVAPLPAVVCSPGAAAQRGVRALM